MEQMHICGVCNQEFETEEQYCDHECSDGYTPKEPEHLGEDFIKVQEAALNRGAKETE